MEKIWSEVTRFKGQLIRGKNGVYQLWDAENEKSVDIEDLLPYPVASSPEPIDNENYLFTINISVKKI